QFFEMRMDDAKIFLIAGEIAASAGVYEEQAIEGLRFSIFVASCYGDSISVIDKLCHGPTLADFRAGGFCVLEQNVVELRALDLDCRNVAGETAIAEAQF